MVIAADGTKWSCISCLKGHRVSGCNHTDRELKLVPKKGRPVTQCQHCRQERKKRSAHVKCDCAEPEKPHHSKEKCIHLREAEDRNKSAHFDDPVHHDRDVAHMAAVAEEQGCCCHHGGKCSCALLRKDSVEGDASTTTPPPPPPPPPRVKPVLSKPRLESIRSDSSIATVFSDGHHRLTHRNHAAHECGMPYKIPMSRARTEQHYPRAMRRSVDNLGLGSSSAAANASYLAAMNIPAFSMPDSRETAERPPESMAQLFGSASSRIGSTADDNAGLRNDSISALDNGLDTSIDPALDEWSAFNSGDLLQGPNSEQFGVSAGNIDGFNLAQPALTAASSGTQSEIDEVPAIEDVFAHGMPSIQEMADFSNQSIDNTDNTSQINRRSLPPNFFGNLDFSIPALNDGWQTQVSDSDHGIYGKSMQDLSFSDPWQATNGPAKTVFGNVVPSERSLDINVAPHVDVLKQLFPDMDLDNQYTPARSRQHSAASYDGTSQTAADGLNTANTVSQLQAMPSQAWADGSMSIPDESYAAPFVHDQYNNSR